MAKFFISSNTILKDFRNPYLTHLLNQASIQNYSSKTFKRTIIPDIMKQVKNGLKDKLNRAKSITMITDLWSNKQMIPSFMYISKLRTSKLCYRFKENIRQT